LFPVLLGLPGGNQKLAPTELKQLLADNSRQSCVARRGRWGPRKPLSATVCSFNKRICFSDFPSFYAAI
jgi:hypothetical protein